MDIETHDQESFALPELDYSDPPAGSDRPGRQPSRATNPATASRTSSADH